ncbi:MAG: chemotaxis protein CheX [Magnetococcus sp. DMHC-1]|nr:chemotaxis protein CheX [Magnetococcales bacterium]
MMSDQANNCRIMVETLQNVTCQILESETWNRVVCEPVKTLPIFQLTQEVCGVIYLLGSCPGVVAVMTSQRSLAAIIKSITGNETRELTQEDLLDGVAELANMVCGGMKSQSQISGITISTPMAIMGSEYVAQWKTAHPTQQLTFHMQDHSLIVIFSI